ncbi:uncharacterized protein MELLADRAFT_90093 [Melampsora larici-populina 98AG31]|uniref:Uncharacterized protein n=1 Tax=Melampsora larici-populina (strain 98AG31 / pathotype 3-4-7) TaxID=747676 RepID=F4RVM7_MELLP|nr:uncharacterized protein MELLADRAFT_90093 [Melampsora larici-populina 98AG31]EGG03553.1 hypothetical protein MELLADRAFT_90093 [Melampsora larici-populina 98AG31]
MDETQRLFRQLYHSITGILFCTIWSHCQIFALLNHQERHARKALHQRKIPSCITIQRLTHPTPWRPCWAYACPATKNTSLIYIPAGEDTVKIRCNTNSGHYYRTFYLNQLKHKIAMINAGNKYPIEYNPSAYGPPVNIAGAVVVRREEKERPRTKHPPPQHKCTRPTLGPTALKHKAAGHAGCVRQHCKSCCQTFGTGDCYVHSQNAQSIGQVGRICPANSRAVVLRAREEAIIQAGKPSIDEGKVVSLHLIIKDFRPPVITHMFKQWPVAIFGDRESLVHQAKEAAGPTWDDHLLVWDEQVRNWVSPKILLPQAECKCNVKSC